MSEALTTSFSLSRGRCGKTVLIVRLLCGRSLYFSRWLFARLRSSSTNVLRSILGSVAFAVVLPDGPTVLYPALLPFWSAGSALPKHVVWVDISGLLILQLLGRFGCR